MCCMYMCVVSPTITNPVGSTATSTITSTTSAVVNPPVPVFPSVSADIPDFVMAAAAQVEEMSVSCTQKR